MEKILKLLTFLSIFSSIYALDLPHPVYEKIKKELLEVGLTFEYESGEHVVRAMDINEDIHISGESGNSDIVDDRAVQRRF